MGDVEVEPVHFVIAVALVARIVEADVEVDVRLVLELLGNLVPQGFQFLEALAVLINVANVLARNRHSEFIVVCRFTFGKTVVRELLDEVIDKPLVLDHLDEVFLADGLCKICTVSYTHGCLLV